jgi:hypothetical protein
VNVISAVSLRKVIYREFGVLTSRVVNEGVSSVLQSLKDSDLEEAKKKLEVLGTEVKTEREKGSLLAASGIYSSMVKAKEGALQTWDGDRIERAAQSIRQSQMADEFDAGYSDTLMEYSKLLPRNAQA